MLAYLRPVTVPGRPVREPGRRASSTRWCCRRSSQYDPIEDKLVITPAATGDLFDVYYSLQNRLNNSLTGSHFGVSSSLGPDFPRTGELLKCCTWLVLGDKLVTSLPATAAR